MAPTEGQLYPPPGPDLICPDQPTQLKDLRKAPTDDPYQRILEEAKQIKAKDYEALQAIRDKARRDTEVSLPEDNFAHNKSAADAAFRASLVALANREASGCEPPKAHPVGRKFDAGKLRYDLLPWGPLADLVRVITYGAAKYGERNWQYLDNPEARYLAAAFRHLTAYAAGEVLDPESGLPHLSHAACSLMFLGWFDEQKAGLPPPLSTLSAFERTLPRDLP